MTNVTGLYALGEANFSDHGANRLGASALMQGLADGYFVIPTPSATTSRPTWRGADDRDGRLPPPPRPSEGAPSAASSRSRAPAAPTPSTASSPHRVDYCGIARNAEGLNKSAAAHPPLREDSGTTCGSSAAPTKLNQELEKAGRVADFFELAELMCIDALDRDESCGGHLREEHQTPEGEALRDDEHFSFVSPGSGTGWARRRPGGRSRSPSTP